MISLGIDTSNYATSLALYDTATNTVLEMYKKLLPVEKGKLGVRQNDAVFHHVKQIQAALQALQKNSAFSQIETVGVSTKPRSIEGSYMPCFLVGETTAKAFAIAKQIPVRTFSHQQGHIAAAIYGAGQPHFMAEKILALHISGGTTEILKVENKLQTIDLLGSSTDLYAGQAIDRLGVLLGFSFPCGQQISDLAETCNEPIDPKIKQAGLSCSLSGLENQFRKMLQDGKDIAYICKYTLLYIAKNIQGMVQHARAIYGNFPIVAAGGVMSSSVIQKYMMKRCDNLFFSSPNYSSDNAVGVAILATVGKNNGECYFSKCT